MSSQKKIGIIKINKQICDILFFFYISTADDIRWTDFLITE